MVCLVSHVTLTSTTFPSKSLHERREFILTSMITSIIAAAAIVLSDMNVGTTKCVSQTRDIDIFGNLVKELAGFPFRACTAKPEPTQGSFEVVARIT